MDLAEVAVLALELPGAVEQDHHGMRSFRVGSKIFATVPDEQHVRIMADREDVLASVAEAPGACAELWWGHRLAGVVVDIERAPRPLVRELLEGAWRRKAPARLRRLDPSR